MYTPAPAPASVQSCHKSWPWFYPHAAGGGARTPVRSFRRPRSLPLAVAVALPAPDIGPVQRTYRSSKRQAASGKQHQAASGNKQQAAAAGSREQGASSYLTVVSRRSRTVSVSYRVHTSLRAACSRLEPAPREYGACLGRLRASRICMLAAGPGAGDDATLKRPSVLGGRASCRMRREEPRRKMPLADGREKDGEALPAPAYRPSPLRSPIFCF